MFDLWVRKIPWRRECLPTPVFLPGESHEQWSLVGYGPWGQTDLDTNERLSVQACMHTHTHTHIFWDLALNSYKFMSSGLIHHCIGLEYTIVTMLISLQRSIS